MAVVRQPASARDLWKRWGLERGGGKGLRSRTSRLFQPPPPTHPPHPRRSKVEHVSEEALALRHALDRHTARARRAHAAAAQRADLLAGAGDASAWAAHADAEAGAIASVRSSRRMLEETLATGAAALVEMSGQRDRLKAARRKALDVLHGLGASDAVLRLVERRQRGDAALAYAGMAAVSLVLVLAWWRFKR